MSIIKVTIINMYAAYGINYYSILKKGDELMRKYRPTRTALYSLQFLELILCALLSIVAWYYLRFFPTLAWIAVMLLVVIYILTALVYLPIYISKTVITIGENEIIVKSGVFFETKSIMTHDAVQYISIVRTPLSKYTSLNNIVVNALGGRQFLLFLSRDNAEEIVDILRERGIRT